MLIIENKKYSLKQSGTGEYELFSTGAGEEFDGTLFITNHSTANVYYASVAVSDGGAASDDEWFVDYQQISPKGAKDSVLKVHMTVPENCSVRVKSSTATTIGFFTMGKLTTTT